MFILRNINRPFGSVNQLRLGSPFRGNCWNLSSKRDAKDDCFGASASRNCSTSSPEDSAKGTVLNRSSAQYEQGQSPEPKIREYFYFIDHQGQLFLDDARVKNFITCFKGSQPNNYHSFINFIYALLWLWSLQILLFLNDDDDD